MQRFVVKLFRYFRIFLEPQFLYFFLGYYLIVPVLLTALAASGFQRITYEADPEYLFSPINGHSKLERQALEKHFPMNYSEFDAGQQKQDINKKSVL